MEKGHNLTKILSSYSKERLWVALSPDKKRVVGKGKTPKEALDMALKKKIKEPSVIQAIPDYSGAVYSLGL